MRGCGIVTLAQNYRIPRTQMYFLVLTSPYILLMIITNLEISSSLCYPFKSHIYASKLKNKSLGAVPLGPLDSWDNCELQC